MNDLAIIALTPHGLALGRRLVESLGHGDVYDVRPAVRERLSELYRSGRPTVCIMALGIVVRILGPLTRDKNDEPAVVVVDEGGHFAISVLGGHSAGANELARQVASTLNATPVITTASDNLHLPAVDLIGRALGWKIEDSRHLTNVAAAVVRQANIAVYQDAGCPNWWQRFGDWPLTFQRIDTWPDASWKAALVISDRVVPPLECPHVIYRPPTLVFGIGCKRGVPWERIEAMFQQVCAEHGLSPLSLGVVASIDLKNNEAGLLQFADHHQATLRFFSADDIEAMEWKPPSPSQKVREKIGVNGVAEPAAILVTMDPDLLVPKQRGDGITMAVARREEA
jgi:cobalt-precorrin 5A hydrolase